MRMIGYCPQFDSIIEVLTGREMLSLFAHIRGIPSEYRSQEVQKWIQFVGNTNKVVGNIKILK